VQIGAEEVRLGRLGDGELLHRHTEEADAVGEVRYAVEQRSGHRGDVGGTSVGSGSVREAP
jgi:hypothetical protein